MKFTVRLDVTFISQCCKASKTNKTDPRWLYDKARGPDNKPVTMLYFRVQIKNKVQNPKILLFIVERATITIITSYEIQEFNTTEFKTLKY